MTTSFIRYFLIFMLCIILQALIFNHIILFQVAVPLVFVYFLICLPINMKLSYLFTVAFLSGIIIDIFSDTPGVNALACTLIAGIRLHIFYAYMPKDDTTSRMTPGVSSMGVIEYAKYLFTFLVIYSILMFSIEYFTFADVKEIAIMAGASTLLTFIILLSLDCLIPVKS